MTNVGNNKLIRKKPTAKLEFRGRLIKSNYCFRHLQSWRMPSEATLQIV